ncbi:MAG: IPTL-CTERM sorting domain-containing protein [Phycisphaerae bacterium]
MLAAAVTFLGAGFAYSQPADPCIVPDDGSGTVVLPPPGCAYLSPTEVHMIIDGLPPNTTIELAPIHLDFICRQGGDPANCVTPGGPLGGDTEVFDSTLRARLTGMGVPVNRAIDIPMSCQVATGPRVPGPLQAFQNEMLQCQGGIVGDPDFADLQIRAGSNFGLPSPGQTTLTDLGNGTWQVDSFFDVTYDITFTGAPGGALAGMTGTTQATIRMEAQATPPPVPTVSEWGLIGMTVLLVGAGAVVIQRRRRLAVA